MAFLRLNLFASNKHPWRYELLLFIVGCMVTIGFTTWFVYGMIKDALASILLKVRLPKSKK